MELLIFWGEKACEAQNFDMSPHDAVMDAAKAAYHGDADPELVLRSLGEADGIKDPNSAFQEFQWLKIMTLKAMLNQCDYVTVCFDCFSEEEILARARGLIDW